VILPADWAEQFASFYAAAPEPCPLIAQSEPGDPASPSLDCHIDFRSDLPRYRVFRDGAAVLGRDGYRSTLSAYVATPSRSPK
jgi:uncharacterized protein YcsI (UPF0317 family)